ncbi:hypothetical protein BDZ89DRAFT_1111794 [Hymenopellis radicata]|nr:hypothetical protein BDZ89DRAFT_1111794 [Hymenopellis radicata]
MIPRGRIGALPAIFLFSLLVALFLYAARSSTSDTSEFPFDDAVPSLVQDTSRPDSYDDKPSPSHGSHDDHAHKIPDSPVAPKITIITIFRKPSREQLHLPDFFASVRANPEIDFLLIKYTQESEEEDGQGCVYVPGLEETPNAREVCLTFDEYWDMHARWTCEQWDDCVEGDLGALKNKMKARASGDMYNGFFRPMRAAIFSRWVDPRTPIWGISDLDEMWGSFDRMFPWDLAPSFDVIIPSSPNWQDDVLIFTPGHMMFYRNSPDVVSTLMKMPNFRTMAAFMQEPFLSDVSEEVEWSHYTILNPHLTFLIFPARIMQDGHISTGDGVFGFDNVGKKQTRPYHLLEDGSGKQSMLTLGQRREFIHSVKDQRERTKRLTSGQRPPTFSKLGQEYEVTLQHGTYSQWLWFPQEYSVHYSPDYNRVPRFDVNRYLMRRAPNGPVTERVEPNPPIPIQVTSDATEAKHEWDNIRIGEALYNHFQVEKYRLYWSLPEEPLKPDEYMFMERYTGVEVWDSDGRVTFSSLLDLEREDEDVI